MLNVVYPLIPGFKHEDFEFRHSLRSLEENLKEEFKVTVIGRYLPLWVKPYTIEFIPTDTGRSKEALKKACMRFNLNRQFLWMNDDIYLGKPVTLDDFKVRRWQQNLSELPHTKSLWGEFKELYSQNRIAGAKFGQQHGMTKWKRRIWATCDILESLGNSQFNYSIHAPYLFDPVNLLELENDFPGIFTSEHVVETAYFNTYHQDWPNVKVSAPDWVGAYSKEQGDSLNIDGATFINHNDDGLTDLLKNKLSAKFHRKSSFEK